jgi:Amt family ammonium transporter
VIAGLVVITPGSGYVPAWAAVVFGIVGGVACNYATKLKYFLRCDDALDIFAVHGVGGFIGNILTAFFAADYIAHLDGYTVIEGGWLNHHWVQLGYQLADSVTGGVYSFVGTCLILGALDFIGKFIPAFRLRATPEEEAAGIDDVEIGEFAYDYVELTREVNVPNDEDVEDGISTDSLETHGAGMARTSHHEKNQESIDSGHHQLAEWAHRA